MSGLLSITVIIPTYNPNTTFLNQVLDALKNQTLDKSIWELIIIDNNSNNEVLNSLDLSWHHNSNIIKETRQGLTYSRIKGFEQAAGDIIVMIDDDNVIAADYLTIVKQLFEQQPQLGSVGGKIYGSFDNYQPERWTKQFWNMLAIRDFGDQALVSDAGLSDSYPKFAPVGAGMAVRKSLTFNYIKSIINSADTITDRTAENLSSGGDNEINIHVLNQGYKVAYHPSLVLKHIIPPSRLTKNYLAKLNYASTLSWIKLLSKYNICPWKPISKHTTGLRKIKAWFNYKAWTSSPVNYINWRGACGMFDGLAKTNQ